MCANNCQYLTSQQCVSTTPIRQDCRVNYTNSAYPCTKVTTTVLDDGCNNKYTSATCNANNCVFDTTLNGNCFLNMQKISVLFPCTYWSSTSTASCQFHPYCVYIAGSSTCEDYASTGNTADNSTTFNFLNTINFLNPTVASGTTTFSVTISTLFATTSFPASNPWPAAISWPIIQILFPVQNVAAYANTVNPLCSTLSNAATSPSYLDITQSAFTVNQLQQYAYNYTTQYGNLNFDNNAIGSYMDLIYNQPLIGASYIVRAAKVSADLTTLQYTFTIDLVAAVKNCAALGAAMTSTSSSRMYTIPISYIEQSYQGTFAQYTQTYTIVVPTTGTATIASSANYPMIATPSQIVFPQTNCPTGSARQVTQWTLTYRNVFDNTRLIGPRYLSDITTVNPQATSTLQNCYNDSLSAFTSLGCDYSNYLCSSIFTTQSNCRVLTTDGLGFNKCSYANAADRIADMGSNVAYPTALDGKHIYYVNSYSCPQNRINDNYCALVVNSAYNYPDPVVATIQTSEYSLTTATLNGFEVQAGFLPYATAPLSSLNVISDTYYTPNGIYKFDPVMWNNLPMTVVIVYPTALMQASYDLRMTIDTTLTIVPTDPLGNVISSRPVITFPQIRASLTYTTKNDYDNGCGSASKCMKLPACNGILGCDGFTISTSILRSLSLGDGYQININYRVGLPNADGSTPNARTLQSLRSAMQKHRRYETLGIPVPISPLRPRVNINGRQLQAQNSGDGSTMMINNTADFTSNIDYYAQYDQGGLVNFAFLVAQHPVVNQTNSNQTSDQYSCDSQEMCCASDTSSHQHHHRDVGYFFSSEWVKNTCANPDFREEYHICEWERDHFVSLTQFGTIKEQLTTLFWEMFFFSSLVTWSTTFIGLGIHFLVRARFLHTI